jgi:membrane fusion protein (multidrug efflux system)
MANRVVAPDDKLTADGQTNGMEDPQTVRAELRQPKRTVPRSRWLLAAAALVVIAAAGFYWFHTAGLESTDDAQIDGRSHSVAARVGGTVLKVHVENNQYVEAGAVLVEIDPRDYEVALDQAKADLAEAKADLVASQSEVPIVSRTSASQLSSAQASVEEARAGVKTAEEEVGASQARLHSAEAAVRQASSSHNTAVKDLERYQSLIAKEEISQQQFDRATSAANSSEARLEASEAQLHEAQQGVAVARSRLEQQRARLAKAEADLRAAHTAPQQVAASQAHAESTSATVLRKKADLEEAQLNLDYTVVKAPVSGIVSQRNVETGEIVQAGQPLMAVVPLDEIWVTANFKESQLANMRPGQHVEVSVDAYDDKSYQGHVESIAAATGARFSLLPPENATGNYVKVVQRVPVKIVLEKGQDADHLLRPGMSVVPTVDTRK